MRVLWTPRAEEDLVEATAFLVREAGIGLGNRFSQAVEGTAAFLGEMPGAGRPWHDLPHRLQGLRSRPVRGFPNHLVFYMPIPDGIRVIRLLHGARDLIWPLLDTLDGLG